MSGQSAAPRAEPVPHPLELLARAAAQADPRLLGRGPRQVLGNELPGEARCAVENQIEFRSAAMHDGSYRETTGGEIRGRFPSPHMDTHLLPPTHPASRLVRELAGIGLAFMDSMSTLIEALDERDPESDENPAEVVLASAAGSIEPALRKVPPDEVERTIELVGAVYERFIADLRLAAEIAGRRESMGGQRLAG